MNIIKELNESSDEDRYFYLSCTIALVIALGSTFFIHKHQIVLGFWPTLALAILAIQPTAFHIFGECKSNTAAIVIGVSCGLLLSPMMAFVIQKF